MVLNVNSGFLELSVDQLKEMCVDWKKAYQIHADMDFLFIRAVNSRLRDMSVISNYGDRQKCTVR